MLLTTDYMIVLKFYITGETGEGSGSEERKGEREGGKAENKVISSHPIQFFMYFQEILTLIACPVVMLWKHNVFLN